MVRAAQGRQEDRQAIRVHEPSGVKEGEGRNCGWAEGCQMELHVMTVIFICPATDDISDEYKYGLDACIIGVVSIDRLGNCLAPTCHGGCSIGPYLFGVI